MDILEKLEAFIVANENEKETIRAKESDKLTNELFLLLQKAEQKGFLEGFEFASKTTLDTFKQN